MNLITFERFGDHNAKIIASIIALTFMLVLLSGCANKEDNAAYIYEINDDVQGDIVSTLTWDDTNELKTITNLVDEAYDSKLTNPDVEMEYAIELVNADAENDLFQIGFVDGMVCGTGNVQGVNFDHAISSTITEDDLINIINHSS